MEKCSVVIRDVVGPNHESSGVCEAIETRRQLSAWIRAMGQLAREIT
jgi:hypothetical protein